MERQVIGKSKRFTTENKTVFTICRKTEKEAVPSFVVGRQVQLSDSVFARCLNSYKSRYLNVKLKNKNVVDLGVLDYLDKMNKTQLLMRLPKPMPCIAMHTARLMRELWLLKQEHNLPYKIREDEIQLRKILQVWFEKHYTMFCKEGEIGYPRRQLMEEAMIS